MVFPRCGSTSIEPAGARFISIGRWPDARLAAEAFYGMLSSHLQARDLLDLEAQVSAERQQAHVDMAVETLLRAWKK